MVEYDAWDFQDDDDEQPIDPRSLPKQLRAVIRDAKREAREAKAEADKLRAENREILVGNVLKSKGVPEKVARLIPADVTSTEAINDWLSDYGDVFSSPLSSAPAEQTPNGEAAPNRAQQFIDSAAGGLSPEEIAAQQRMQVTASSAQPFGGRADELLAKLNDPELTPEQLDALIRKGGL